MCSCFSFNTLVVLRQAASASSGRSAAVSVVSASGPLALALAARNRRAGPGATALRRWRALGQVRLLGSEEVTLILKPPSTYSFGGT
jgi:hypothetical protein